MVILGPDHVGKSTLIGALAAEGCRVLSCDDALLHPAYAALGPLRAAFEQAIAGEYPYSHEFLLAGFSLPMLYLRDELARARSTGYVFVDSYYYKLAAKCRLLRWDAEAVTASWRRFEQPDLAIVLEASDEVLWQRASSGRKVGAFERWDGENGKAAFLGLQRALMTEVERELGGVPRVHLDASATPAALVTQVLVARDALHSDAAGGS